MTWFHGNWIKDQFNIYKVRIMSGVQRHQGPTRAVRCPGVSCVVGTATPKFSKYRADTELATPEQRQRLRASVGRDSRGAMAIS